jgi:hypothetical protein
VTTGAAARARYELTVVGVVGPAVDRMLHTAGVTRAETVTCVRATVTGPRGLGALLDAAVLAELQHRGHRLDSVVTVR